MSKSKIFFVALISIIMIAFLAGVVIAKEKVKIIDGFKVAKGKLAPRFEAETTTGETFNLESLRGQKSVVISFWATWCVSCCKEFPYLEKFYEKHKDTCEVIGISKDTQRDKRILENKLKELKITFPIIHDYSDRIRSKLYPSKTIPHLIIIGRDGVVLEVKLGIKDPAKLAEELEKILGDNLKPKPEGEAVKEGNKSENESKSTPPEEGKS